MVAQDRAAPPGRPVIGSPGGERVPSDTMGVRVLWVVKGLGPGGAERLLASAARFHDHTRFEFDCAYVLAGKDHLAGELEQAGVRTRCLSSTRRDRRWAGRLWRLVRSGGYDVVHVHSPLPGSVARLAARSLPAQRRPLVVATEHNTWATHRAPTRWANRLTGRWEAVAVAVTDEVRASMRGRAAAVATTVRHGIDLDAVRAGSGERAVVRAELGVGPDEFVVGTIANYRPQKDYPNLLLAARELADQGVPVRFVAVGQGPDEAAIRARRDELGLGDRVLLTGFRADAVRVLAASDVFTMGSQWEGLPVALMEALALGLPVVATAVGGLAEELRDGDDALLVPPRDPVALAGAIRRVVDDDDLRMRLAAAAARRAADFDVRHAVEFYEGVYAGRAARPAAPDATGDDPTRDPTGGAADDRPASPAVRHAPAGVEVRAATADDRSEILGLLGRSLGADAADPRYRELYAWKHDHNRFGSSPTWVAVEAGRIVAVRAFLRWEFERGGEVLRAVRAVDTATDPTHQGRGLFTLLTLHGLEAIAADGVEFVFNTPNQQSRPGYLKMGWQVVGQLPTTIAPTGPAGAIRAVRSRVPAERWSLPLEVGDPVPEWLERGGPGERRRPPADVRRLHTRDDDAFLAWRYGTPLLGYRVVDDGDAAIIVRARRRGRASELALVAGFGDDRLVGRLAARTARRAGVDYVARLGGAHLSAGEVPLPGGGPVLTWRAVAPAAMPALANWSLSLGDIELF